VINFKRYKFKLEDRTAERAIQKVFKLKGNRNK
jgi:hypothetical protein